MGWPIDKGWKGCESTECWTHIVASNFDLIHDLDLRFSRLNIEIAVTQQWEVSLTWNERDVSWIWCWMHNGIDLGPRSMTNRSAKLWVNVKLLQFPTCWPVNGLFVHWTRGWVGVVVLWAPCSPCSYHRIIMKFSGLITNDKNDVHAKGQGQRSKVKVTEVNTQLNSFRTVTLVWIHIWWWNDAYSLMMLRRGALLFLKVIRQISKSHGSKKLQIWPRLGVSGL